MNYDSEVIGKKLLTERKKRGWTRAKLSELTNISEKQIYKYVSIDRKSAVAL